MAPGESLQMIFAIVAVCMISQQVCAASLDSLTNGGASRRQLSAARGYWNTSGSKIIASDGTEVFFSGVNFGGFEADCRADVLYTARPLKEHVTQMASLGFNLVRLPFSSNCVQPGVMPGFINLTANPTLKGKTALEVMQEVVKAFGNANIRVILDYHRINSTDPATGAPEHGLWYNETYPTSYFLDTWRNVTEAFRGIPAVVGVDLFNEPYAAVWDMSDAPNNWRTAAQSAADVIQELMPDWLICIQGLHDNSNWGGNMRNLVAYPITLKVANKLVYSPHEYGPLVANNSWFEDPTFPTNLQAHWDNIYGFVKEQDRAPLWIGEFGTLVNLTSQEKYQSLERQWIYAFVDYVRLRGLSWTWWQWGPNSGDTGGLLLDDWATVEQYKLDLLQPVMYPQFKLQAGSPSPAVPGPANSIYAAPPPSAPATPSPPTKPNSGLRSHGTVTLGGLLGAILWAFLFLGW